MKTIDIESILKQSSELGWVGNSAISELSKSASLELYDPREVVYQGVEGTSKIYLVVSGAMHVMLLEYNYEKLERIYMEHHILGMRDLFDCQDSHERMAVAEGSLLLVTIPLDRMRDCLKNDPSTSAHYEALSRNYEAYHFLKNSTFLGEILSPSFLVEFVNTFECKTYEASDPIFMQGDAPDGFYLCGRGQLKVEVKVNGDVVFSASIQEGDYFGELALTHDSARSASIFATKSTTCYFLSKENFNTLVKHEPRLLEGFELLAKLAYGN